MRIKEKQNENYPEYVGTIPVGEIIRSIASIQHGRVELIIQDSRVVQIDKTEKKRIKPPEQEYEI